MDEIISRWATDLEKYKKEFQGQAKKVQDWDRMLVDNGEKIQQLYLDTYEAERASNEIDRQLQAVESNQDELVQFLERYEKDVDEMFNRQIVTGGGEQLSAPDQERERTYKLAERLTDRLDEMGKDLTKMIKEINDISGSLSKGGKPDDPVSTLALMTCLQFSNKRQLTQIVRVLNGHLSQLQWIDTNAAALQAKVVEAQKRSSNIGNHNGAAESEVVESFGRSMHRKR